jgi:hypothetical protein
MPELPTPHLVNPHLVKVPDAAPPYDCQIHGDRCPGADAGQTVLGEVDAPPVAVLPVAVPSVAAPSVAELAVVAADLAIARSRQAALVIVEVLAGVRPDRQLVPLATERVRARVRGLAPLLASERRPRIARVVTSRPAARIVEMTVVASFGARSRALAMRFEHVAGRPAAPGWPARPPRWLCTAIEAR